MIDPNFDPEALKELIEGSGAKFRQSTVSYVFTCPRCDKKDKLYLRKKDGQFICWVCADNGFRGRPEYALAEILSMSVKAVQRELYGDKEVRASTLLDLQVRNWLEEGEVDEDAYEPVEVKWPFDYYPIDHKFSKKGAAYLESRGIPLSVASAFDLRYCPKEQRVYFPVSSNGKLYGWQGRAVGPTEFVDSSGRSRSIPKVVTTKHLKKEHTLMFADQLHGSDHAVLCEGPIDCLKAAGFGGNVASMGKGVSRSQINLLRHSGITKLYLALDPDAYLETMALTREFPDLEVYWVTPPKPFKDLGEMPIADVTALCRLAPRANGALIRGFINPKGVPSDFLYG